MTRTKQKPLAPYSVIDCGIDDLHLSTGGDVSDLLFDLIHSRLSAKSATRVETPDGELYVRAIPPLVYRARQVDRDPLTNHVAVSYHLRRLDGLTIRRPADQTATCTLMWPHIDHQDGVPDGDVLIRVTRTTQRFTTILDLAQFLDLFVEVDPYWFLGVRLVDFFIDRVVPEGEHYESVLCDGRYRHDYNVGWEQYSRQYGSLRSGISRDYDKQREMRERYNVVYCDRLPAGHTAQRTEAGCAPRRLRRLLGTDERPWLYDPTQKVRLWHFAFLGLADTSPFHMFRRFVFRDRCLPRHARHHESYAIFREHLPRIGIIPAYRFASQNKVVRTWFSEVPFAEEITPPVIASVRRFLSPMLANSAIATVIHHHLEEAQYRQMENAMLGGSTVSTEKAGK